MKERRCCCVLVRSEQGREMADQMVLAGMSQDVQV